MSLLLFGATGQLGRSLTAALAKAGRDFVALSRTDLDLARQEDVAALIATRRPSVILNAAAYTKVDQAETEPALCDAINHGAVAAMAAAARSIDALLVTYSTDYVFDGSKKGDWREDDPASPLNVYGQSKKRGEDAALSSGARVLILRTAWLYSHEGGFPARLLAAAKTRPILSVPEDQIGQPTSAASLAQLTLGLLDRYDGTLPGLYHCAGQERLSRAAWARRVVASAGLSTRIVGVETSTLHSPAQRPLNSCLDCAKLQHDFGLGIEEPHPQDAC